MPVHISQQGSSGTGNTWLDTGTDNLGLINSRHTIFAWVNLPANLSGTGGADIFAIERVPGTKIFAGNFFQQEFGIQGDGLGGNFVFVRSQNFGTPSPYTARTPNGSVTANEWNAIAGVYNGTGSRKAYVLSPTEGAQSGTNLLDPGQPGQMNGCIIAGGWSGSAGFSNSSYNGCISHLTVWNIALSDDEIAELQAGVLPNTIQTESIVLYVPFASPDTVTQAFQYTSGEEEPYTLNLEVGAGGVLTCDDAPPITDGEGGDAGEDVPDDVTPCDVEWDACVLVPRNITVEIVSPTSSPGRSHSGRQQIVQHDAGFLRVTLHDVKVWSSDELFTWREYESTLDGRNGTCCVPLYEAKLSDTPIAATLGASAPVGAVSLTINQTTGAPIRAGMHFQVGERAYRLISGSGTSWKVRPPLRDAVTSGDSLNFNDPSLRCRLERDDGMDLMLEHLRFGKKTVTFVEDV